MFSIVTLLVFAASASAEHVYGGLSKDNPDIQGHAQEQARMAAESEASSEIKVYHGLAEQNPDLVGKRDPSGPTGKNPDVYEGFEPSPGLSY
jgi:hypothetical protein